MQACTLFLSCQLQCLLSACWLVRARGGFHRWGVLYTQHVFISAGIHSHKSRGATRGPRQLRWFGGWGVHPRTLHTLWGGSHIVLFAHSGQHRAFRHGSSHLLHATASRRLPTASCFCHGGLATILPPRAAGTGGGQGFGFCLVLSTRGLFAQIVRWGARWTVLRIGIHPAWPSSLGLITSNLATT